MRADLPDGFWFGAATAAYQIEGGVRDGGRGPSIWDTFVAREGAVRNGDTGDVACDHYHRWEEDLDLLADLGLDAYRFSISWPRVQPDGRGRLNPAGVDFYHRLIEGLHERGVAPVVTLFHWDLPQALEDADGWMNRDTAKWFADYAAAMADQFADRVELWLTLNEPVVHMSFGYMLGIHAPGRKLRLGGLSAGYHQLLGHGLAVGALRDNGARTVGITNNLTPVWPASDRNEDIEASAAYDAFHNGLFLDPVLRGELPPRVEAMAGDTSFVHDGDLGVIAAPIDVLGVNYYVPTLIGAPRPGSSMPFERLEIEGRQTTHFGWPVVPEGLTELLVGLPATYGDRLPPIQITENGCSSDDRVVGGVVDDAARIRYLSDHVQAVADAVGKGVDVDGYFVWSLLDNFEWAEGYAQRFGLVHVDFDTQVRTPKASYHWLREQLAR